MRQALMMMLLLLSTQARAQGEIDAAEANAAVRPDAVGWFRLGKLQRAHGKPAKALHSFARALEFDPGLTHVHLAWGSLLLELERPQAAVEHLDIYVREFPGDGEARWRRGQALALLGKPDEAEGDLRAAFWTLSKPTPGLALEWISVCRGRKALRAVDEAMRILGPLPELMDKGVALELLAGNLGRALRRLDAYRPRLSEPEWRRRRAQAFFQCGRDLEARMEASLGLLAFADLPRKRKLSPPYLSIKHSLDEFLAVLP